jgi:hypothetical protein
MELNTIRETASCATTLYHCMGPAVLLPLAQEHSACPYPEPETLTPCHHILSIQEFRFNSPL